MATTSRTRRRRTTGAAPAAAKERSFADYGTKRVNTPGNICPRCKENEKAGNVGVRMNEKTEEGGNMRQVTSRHIQFCEPCCIAVYEELVGGLESEGGTNGDD